MRISRKLFLCLSRAMSNITLNEHNKEHVVTLWFFLRATCVGLTWRKLPLQKNHTANRPHPEKNHGFASTSHRLVQDCKAYSVETTTRKLQTLLQPSTALPRDAANHDETFAVKRELRKFLDSGHWGRFNFLQHFGLDKLKWAVQEAVPIALKPTFSYTSLTIARRWSCKFLHCESLDKLFCVGDHQRAIKDFKGYRFHIEKVF